MMIRWWLTMLGALAMAAPLNAQSPAERAAVANAAWRRAAASQKAGLPDSAWADLQRAHAAWPAQPAYTAAVARLAAERGDTAALERVLRTLAAQGVGGGVAADSAVAVTARRTAGGAAALAALRLAIEPHERSRPRVLSSDTMFFAEGIAADTSSGILYVTSIRHRAVYAAVRDKQPKLVFGAAHGDIAAPIGVAFDHVRRILWIATAALPHMRGYQPSDSARAELLSIRPADGVITGRWRLGSGTGVPGELALMPDGDVLVSDAALGRLYRLRAGSGIVETVEHPLLRSPQGIAVNDAGDAAWVADWSHGLLRWNLDTNEIAPVATPDHMTLLGIDGMRRVDNRLIGVQNGVAPARIVSIALSGDGLSVRALTTLDRPARLEGEPTVGTTLGNRYLYIAASAWPFWTADGRRRAGSGPLPPVVVRELPLPQRGSAGH